MNLRSLKQLACDTSYVSTKYQDQRPSMEQVAVKYILDNWENTYEKRYQNQTKDIYMDISSDRQVQVENGLYMLKVLEGPIGDGTVEDNLQTITNIMIYNLVNLMHRAIGLLHENLHCINQCFIYFGYDCHSRRSIRVEYTPK